MESITITAQTLLSKTNENSSKDSNMSNQEVGNGCHEWAETFSNYIFTYGFPKETNIYDVWYNGFWKECTWNNKDNTTTTEWVWMNPCNSSNDVMPDKLQNINIKHVINNIYWNSMEYINDEYVWDEYYNGWWIKSNNILSSNEDIWIWIG